MITKNMYYLPGWYTNKTLGDKISTKISVRTDPSENW